MQAVSFTITCYKDFEHIRPAVKDFLQQYLSGSDYCRTEIALNEAVNNALKFGPGTIENPILICLEKMDDKICVRVKDRGPGFNVQDIMPNLNSNPEEALEQMLMAEHGRGIFVMRSAVDEVIYNNAGNEVTLVKNIT